MPKIELNLTRETIRELAKHAGTTVREVPAWLEETMIPEFLADNRRTKRKRSRTSIRWPEDWYDRMIQKWGRGRMAHEVYVAVHENLLRLAPDANIEGPPPYVEKDDPHEGEETSHDKPTSIKWPSDWHDLMRKLIGHGGISHFVKCAIRPKLDTNKRYPLSPLKGEDGWNKG